MEITKKWLVKNEACDDGLVWFLKQKLTDPIELIDQLMKENHFDWAVWGIAEILNKNENVRFSILCAQSVLHLFEEKYPDDKRPRKAIEAAEKYLKAVNDYGAESVEAARAAYDAADAAAATAATTAYAAARAAANAARAAARAAAAAADADAADAADVAAYNAARAGDAVKKQIVEFGKTLINK